ncbi:MAG: thioredoxin family protein [Aquificaceae bacterium]|nr:thioredoxin family protein [Aquificaceae bacterium]MCX8059761.1 thioredoxin family protein [Aquificaceae bacterium]MDW8096922.1 thioredoxin family protein [Aquificaceae bacterium]
MESLLKLLAIFLLLFFSFLLVMRLVAVSRSKRMQGKSFDKLKEGIVYFYSERCGACKLMKPQVEKLKERVQVLEVDVAKPEGYKLAQEMGVVATPTTLVVKGGVVQRVFVGVVKYSRLLQEVLS